MLTDKGRIIISSTSIPSATEQEIRTTKLDPTYESLADENSGRVDSGAMEISWIYQRIRKLSIAIAPSSSEVISQISARVQGQKYYLTYFDVLSNRERTIHVYTSTCSATCVSGVLYDGLYELSFNAIELSGENNDLTAGTAQINVSRSSISIEVE